MLEVSITVYWATWRSSPIVKLNPCDAAAAFLVCYAVASLVATLYCVATWSIVQRCASAIVKAICYAVAPASLMSSAPCQSWCLAVRASAYAWTTLLVAVFVLVLIVRTKNLRESCRQVVYRKLIRHLRPVHVRRVIRGLLKRAIKMPPRTQCSCGMDLINPPSTYHWPYYRDTVVNDFNETVHIPRDCRCPYSDYGISAARSPDDWAALHPREPSWFEDY